MKTIAAGILLNLVLFKLMLGQQATTNAAIEQQIRQLEQQQAADLLRGDLAAMKKYWAPDCVVNHSFQSVGATQLSAARPDSLAYKAFTRSIEQVLIHEQTVVVMGAETVIPSANSADAGQTIKRRFTDVWMNTTGNWLLVARQANTVSEDRPLLASLL